MFDSGINMGDLLSTYMYNMYFPVGRCSPFSFYLFLLYTCIPQRRNASSRIDVHREILIECRAHFSIVDIIIRFV